MKKLFILCTSLLQIIFCSSQVPKKIIANQVLTKPVSIFNDTLKSQNEFKKIKDIKRDTIFDIELFEQSNYRGRRGYFVNIGGRIAAPFATNNISVKVPNGKIVYIKTVNEFPVESAFVGKNNSVTLDQVIGVRSDDLTAVFIEFDGISTVIHNHDCRRVYGHIKIRLIETSPGRDPVQANMDIGKFSILDSLISGRNNIEINRPNRQSVEEIQSQYFLPFNKRLENWNFGGRPNRNVDSYYFIYDGKPGILLDYPRYIQSKVSIGRYERTLLEAPSSCYFYAGKNALKEGRVKLAIETDLSSAHKTCDFCDDYTSRIKLERPVHEVISIDIFKPGTKIIETAKRKIIMGPYVASGIRDGFAVTATSRIHKKFMTYYKLRFFN